MRRNAVSRLVLLNIAEMAMIGTTGSAPISGTKHQRHQRAGAVARHAADDGGKQSNAGDQRELVKRYIGKAGKDVHEIGRGGRRVSKRADAACRNRLLGSSERKPPCHRRRAARKLNI